MTHLNARLGAIAAFFALCIGAAAPAAAKVSEQFCDMRGFARPVRQTIMLIDEASMHPSTGAKLDPQNLPWTRLIGKLVDHAALERAGIFLPRERLTIMMLRADGAEPQLIFTGCMAFFSTQEKSAIAAKSGSLGRTAAYVFESGPVAEADKVATRMQSEVASALLAATQPEKRSRQPVASTAFEKSGVITSLRRAKIVNLAAGIPRIMIYSDLSRLSLGAAATPQAARVAGFAAAKAAPLSLDRAEVYVMGVPGSPRSAIAEQGISAYLLASQGWLRGWTQDLPSTFDANPMFLRTFAGFVRYGAHDFPMRLRLAYNGAGRAVNSWVSVQTDVETSTPFSADLICQAQGKCRVVNDAKSFAQIWSVNSDDAPEFDAKMPFSGLRKIEFKLENGKIIDGRISDPAVTEILGSTQNYIPFSLAPQGVLY